MIGCQVISLLESQISVDWLQNWGVACLTWIVNLVKVVYLVQNVYLVTLLNENVKKFVRLVQNL